MRTTGRSRQGSPAPCSFSNTGLFLTVTGTCFAVFALLYALVYRITSNAYFRLVSGRK